MGSRIAMLVTGGAGFIGSNLCHYLHLNRPDERVVCLDKLTYAGNLRNLEELMEKPGFRFIRGDITDEAVVEKVFAEEEICVVFHLAAESHVDRSIAGPKVFVETNVMGTLLLLEAARKRWDSSPGRKLFVHVSTDEVYGSLGKEGRFTEKSPYAPSSPYSATKAGSDHLVRAYHRTYGLPAVITHCSNNYGPYQFPEKLIPLMINNIVREKPLPVYGDGSNVRDWIHVEDHCRALLTAAENGEEGETYNIGGGTEIANIEMVRLLCDLVDARLKREKGYSHSLIRFVKDRPGHDQRYAIDSSKIRSKLGLENVWSFEDGLARTVDWYLGHGEWVSDVTSGEYQKYYDSMYGSR